MIKCLRRVLQAVLVCSILLTACEVNYEPHIPTMDWQGGEAEDLGEVLPPTVGPYGVTCEGDPSAISYCEVDCPVGPEDALCYRLCFRYDCGVYSMSDPDIAARVNAYIRAVHNWEQAVTSEDNSSGLARLDLGGAAAACFTAAGGAAVAAGRFVAEGGPNPLWVAVAGIVVAVGGVGACIIAGVRHSVDSGNADTAVMEQIRWFREAAQQYEVLRGGW
jgi:hypothetical protein